MSLRPTALWLMAVMLIALRAGMVEAQLSPFAEFQGLTQEQLATVQCKFTDVGDQDARGAYTLALSVTGHPVNVAVFRPFYRSGYSYSMDGRVQTGSLAVAEIDSFIDAIATLPNVTDGGADGYLSLSLSVEKSGAIQVFESILDTTSSRAVLDRLLLMLQGNPSALATVEQYACRLGMLNGPTISDVTDRVSIKSRGFRKQKSSGFYVGKVRVKNTSGQTIMGPIILAFVPDEGVALVEPDGKTCAVWPPSAPYKTLAVSGLSPGQETEIILRFDSPDDDAIVLNHKRVFAGAGYR